MLVGLISADYQRTLDSVIERPGLSDRVAHADPWP
jgi:hypothetical protein